MNIVTGGASAPYGSGAVAGVLNFFLDERSDGFKAAASADGSSRGDNESYKAMLSYDNVNRPNQVESPVP